MWYVPIYTPTPSPRLYLGEVIIYRQGGYNFGGGGHGFLDDPMGGVIDFFIVS